MGNPCCSKCGATSNSWWHKAANERNPAVIHPKVHTFIPESHEEWVKRMRHP